MYFKALYPEVEKLLESTRITLICEECEILKAEQVPQLTFIVFLPINEIL